MNSKRLLPTLFAEVSQANVMRGLASYFLIIFSSLHLFYLNAQSQQSEPALDLGVASPTAAALGKFGDIPVSLYTGTPNISISLCEIKGRTLTVPITLQYHASGVKVEEIAGWVGQGWALDAGGVITRTVRGLIDDSQYGYLTTGSDLAANFNNPSRGFLNRVMMRLDDVEPDVFFFNFSGRAGRFVFGTDGQVRVIPFQKLRIIPTKSSYQITRWTVTTEDGTRYLFNRKEVTNDNPGEPPTSRSYTSSWYLSRIESPAGADSISFYYSTPTGVSHQFRNFDEEFTPYDALQAPCTPSNSSIINSYIIQAIRLDSVKSALHTVTFSASLRQDADLQERKLDLMTVYTNSYDNNNAKRKLQRKFEFIYGYFNNADPDPNVRRLRLDSVTEYASDGITKLPPYKFDYDASQNLPKRDSFFIDHWGYFNGKSNTKLIPAFSDGHYNLTGANRDPDPLYLKAGTLTKITYPTGGYTEFTYEAHDYGWIGPQQVTSDNGPPQSATVVAQDIERDSTNFTITSASQVAVCIAGSLNEGPGCPQGDDCDYTLAQIRKVSDNSLLRDYRTPGAINDVIYLAAGTYKLIAQTFATGAYANLYVHWVEQISVNKKDAGGLRIKRIRSHDGISTANDVIKRFVYKMTTTDTARSSGVLVRAPRYHYHHYLGGCTYLSLSSISKTPLGTTQGSHIGYREVKVLYGDTGQNGWTIHKFRSPVENHDLGPDAWPFISETSYDWKRGLAFSIEDRNNSDIKQKRVENTYVFKDALPSPVKTVKVPAMAIDRYINQVINDTTYVWDTYQEISSWSYADSEKVITHDQNGLNPVTTIKQFFYDDTNHVQLTRIIETNSDGAKRTTKLKYPLEYLPPSSTDPYIQAIDSMRTTKHMHNVVIEKTVREQKSGQSETVIAAELMRFKKSATGQVLPDSIKNFFSTTPVTNFVESTISGGSFIADTRYRPQTTNAQYDSYGNLQLAYDANNTPTTTIYGYNSSLPVAKIGNATVSQAVVCVFDDSSASGWSSGVGSWSLGYSTGGVYKQTDASANFGNNPRRYDNVSIDDAVLEADIRFDDNINIPSYVAVAKYVSNSSQVRFVLSRIAAGSRAYIYEALVKSHLKSYEFDRGKQGFSANIYVIGYILYVIGLKYLV